MLIVVVGAGLMGAGIAQVVAEAGLRVRLYSRHRESLDGARDRMARNQTDMRAAGLVVDEASLDRLEVTQDLGAEAARTPQAVLEHKLARGESGAGAGRGFYEYPSGAHEALISQRDACLMALRRVPAAGANR